MTPGSLYPLRCGLAFVSTSKAVFLPTSRWDGITVGRAVAGGANSTFDLLVSTAGTTVGTEFSLISREELPLIQEYVTERCVPRTKVSQVMHTSEAHIPIASLPLRSKRVLDSGGSGGSSDEEDSDGGDAADARPAGSDDSEDDVDVSAFVIKKQRTE